jgi:hypothetical protein
MKPSELVVALKCALSARLVPFIWGASGIGKTELVHQIAADDDRDMKPIHAAQFDPVDLRGLPSVQGGKTTWCVPDFLPTSGRGILFLDELPSAPQLVQAACYQLTLERRLGEYVLPDEWLIIAAGNPASVKGVHFAMPYPLRNRFVHFHLDPDIQDWSRWALAHQIDPMMVAFLRFRPGLLHDAPTTDVNAWPTPRTWSMASRAVQAATGQGLKAPAALQGILAGTIGEGAAAEYLAFAAMAANLPSTGEILLNPDHAPVPDGPDGRIAVATALGRAISATNIDSAARYLKRMEPEFLILSMRDAAARDRAITLTHTFTTFAIEHQGALV